MPGGRHDGGDERRGAARHRPGLRPGLSQTSAPTRASAAARPTCSRLLADSEIVASHRENDDPRPGRVLDALRAAGGRAPPATRSSHAAGVAERGAARRPSTTRACWPTAGSRPTATSTGHRSGTSLDFLAIAAASLARSPSAGSTGCWTRPAHMGCRRSWPPSPGVDSGLMIAQYTAGGDGLGEQTAGHPASVDSIPTSGMQEDHVSMGWNAGLKLRRAIQPSSHPGDRAGRRRPGRSNCERRCRPARLLPP